MSMSKRDAAKAQVRARQIRVMEFIRQQGKATTTEIIEHFGLSSGSIGGIVGQLLLKGEIVGVYAGKKNRNRNSVLEYHLTGEIHEPVVVQETPHFLLGEAFKITPPDARVVSVRRHVCAD